MEDNLYRKLIEQAEFGYAYHSILLDDEGKPINYKFLEINDAFTNITGLQKEKVVGFTVKEILPDIDKSAFDWIGYYGNIAINGGSSSFEQYSELLKRWYKVQVYSYEKGFFVTIFLDITEQKTVADELEKFFSVNLDMLCIADISGRFIKVNKEWEKVLGYSIDELENHIFLDFVHEDDLQPTIDAINHLANDEEVLNFVNRYRCKDGSYRFIEWRSRPQGQMIYAAARDITEKVFKQRVAELRLKLIDYSISNNLDALISFTIDEICDLLSSPIGFFHFINEDQKTISLQEWSTKTKESYCNVNAKGLHYPIEKAGIWADCFRERKAIVHNDYPNYPHKKGLPEDHSELIRELVVPVFRDNKIVAILGMGNKTNNYTEDEVEFASQIADIAWSIISDKMNETELKIERELFAEGPVFSLILDVADLSFKYFSKNTTKILGYSNDELKDIIYTFRNLLSDVDYALLINDLSQSMANNKNYFEQSIEINLKDGSYRWFYIFTMIVRNDKNEAASLRCYLFDQTHIKEIENSLEKERQNLDYIISGTNAGTWEWNIQTGETVFNERWAEIIGYSLEELSPISINTWLEFIHPDDAAISNEKINRHFSGETEFYEVEVRMRHKNGYWVWILDKGKVYQWDESGNPLMMYGTHIDITQRKRTELSLKRSEERYRLLIDNTLEGIFVVQDGGLVFVNSMCEKITGFSREELLGVDFIELAHPEDKNKIITNHPKRLKNENAENGYQVRVIKKDGTFAWVEVSGALIEWNGEPATINFIADVTNRKNAEDALRKSEEKYRLLTDNSSDVIWVLNLNQGKFSYISPAIFRLRGLTVEEAINEKLEDALTPESLELVTSLTERNAKEFLADTSDPHYSTVEIVQPHKNGSLVWVEVSTRLNLNAQGELEVIGVSRDIEERKKAETALRESEEKLRAVFAAANIGVSIVDLNGRYTYSNKWWSDYLKYTESELNNLTTLEVTYKDDSDISIKMFNKLVGKEIESYRIEKRFICKDGSIVWGDLSVAPVMDISGNVVFLIGMIIDISEKKIAEEKLRSYSIELEMMNDELRLSKEIIECNLMQKNALIDELEFAKSELELSIKEKDKFFSIIAHDLRNPLGNLRNIASIMHKSLTEFNQEELNDYFDILKNSADNVYQLLENLLDWSRSQRGVLPFNPLEVNMNMLAENTCELLRPIAQEKSIELICSVNPEINTQVDVNMITTVFRNLISNAIKFTPHGGKVVVGNLCENNNDDLTFYVEDDGIGIDETTQENLFRIDNNITSVGTAGEKGTGLGLILCKEFIEKHNGKIWVESQIGIGSRFYISLPKRKI